MNLQKNIVKLIMREPVALGRARDDAFVSKVLTLPSDTLKAAIVSATAQLHSPELTNNLNQNLIVSSAFPFFNEHLFFPKPFQNLQTNPHPDTTPGLAKKVKKIEFLEKSLFEKVIQGQKIDLNVNNVGLFLFQKTETQVAVPKIFEVQTVERVTLGCKPFLNDADEKGTPYYFTRTYFNNLHGNQSGFWFIFEAIDGSDLRPMLEQALFMLKDAGIGSDRNLGHGKFEFKIETMNLQVPDQPNAVITLSKFIPTQEELAHLDLEKSMYNLTKRTGYMAGALDESKRHWQRKSIWLFNETSIFFTQSLKGKNVEISQSENALRHKVFRDGRPIFIPILMQN